MFDYETREGCGCNLSVIMVLVYRVLAFVGDVSHVQASPRDNWAAVIPWPPEVGRKVANLHGACRRHSICASRKFASLVIVTKFEKRSKGRGVDLLDTGAQ